MSGIIELLNIGTGDTKITFDKNNPEDVERAKRIIPDMIKRGYAHAFWKWTNQQQTI